MGRAPTRSRRELAPRAPRARRPPRPRAACRRRRACRRRADGSTRSSARAIAGAAPISRLHDDDVLRRDGAAAELREQRVAASRAGRRAARGSGQRRSADAPSGSRAFSSPSSRMSRETVAWVTRQPAVSSASSSSCCVPSRMPLDEARARAAGGRPSPRALGLHTSSIPIHVCRHLWTRQTSAHVAESDVDRPLRRPRRRFDDGRAPRSRRRSGAWRRAKQPPTKK